TKRNGHDSELLDTNRSLDRLRRRIRDGNHLVAAVAVPILSEPFLRSMGAKFLPVWRGMPGHPAFPVPAIPSPGRKTHLAAVWALCAAMPAQCSPSGRPGACALLYWSRRLRD